MNTSAVRVKSSGNAGLVSAYPTANGENAATPSAQTWITRPSDPSTSSEPGTGAPRRNSTRSRSPAASRRPTVTGRHSRTPPGGAGATVTSTATREAGSRPRENPGPAASATRSAGNGATVTDTARSRSCGSVISTSSARLSTVTVTSRPFTL